MADLDEKLGGILADVENRAHFDDCEVEYCEHYTTPENFKDEVAQIKQAFADAGYVKIPTVNLENI